MKRQILLSLEITQREIRDQLRDWRILLPFLFLSLVFPLIMNFAVQQILKFAAANGIHMVGERMVPFLLMIVGFFPIAISLVVALESFVGEKERGTIEPLLDSPLKDWQLYLGKMLAVILPPLAASYLAMTVYLLGLGLKHIPFPPFVVILQILSLTTVQAVMMVSSAVVISSQATSVRAANLLSSFIIIPMALLTQGESLVMFWGDYSILWWVVFGLIMLTTLLVRVGLAHFQREELLGREIDTLDLRWLWQVFRQGFVGGARSPWDWYIRVVPSTLRELRLPMLLVTALAVIAVWVGTMQVYSFRIPIEDAGLNDINGHLRALVAAWPLFDYHPLLTIWWQNVRALLLAMLLGSFSFGILGMIPLFFTLGSAAYLTRLVTETGVPVWTYIAGFFVPHGLIEIPVAILATAAVLKSGALLASRSTGKTVGELWVASLASYTRVMLGLVIPLLFVAAGVEAWFTPRFAMWLFGY